MDSYLEKTDVDINSLLMSWGLMTGRYEDEVIRTTKLGKFNMLFVLSLFSFEAIKWIILMFYPEDSLIANYLGEFLQYFG